MYRIEFDPAVGMFIIQVLRYGMIWVTVNGKQGDEPIATPFRFNKFSTAQAHVSQIGLDKLYENKSADRYRAHVSSPAAA